MVLTPFALFLRRNWSARAGELHACEGWSFTAGGLLSKAMLLLTQLHAPVQNKLVKDAEEGLVG